jgi:hypothetical protein
MTKAPNTKPRRLAFAVAVAMGTLPAAGWAAAGRIQFAWGDVTVQQNSGGNARLKRGDHVDAGDTIVTERGRAQIKFTDGSFVSLQPESSFKIEDYSFERGSANTGRNFMSLFRGGLRAISGAIGRSNRDSYRLNTPVGTIGIRGTEYLIILDGSGAIVTVGDGAIALLNDAGEVVLVNGQTGRIADRSSLPVIVDGRAVVPPPPKNVGDDPGTDQTQQDGEETQVTTYEQTEDGANEERDLRSVVVLPPPVVDPPIDPVIDTPIVPPPLALESGAGFTVGFTFFQNVSPFGPVNTRHENVDATFDTGQLTAWQNGALGSDIGALDLVAFSDGFIGWGRWTNPAGANGFTIDGVAQQFNAAGQSMHFVVGQPSDLAALAAGGAVQANYSVLGFTNPTNSGGFFGEFIGASFGVDFANQDVSGTIDTQYSSDIYRLEFFDVAVTGGGFSGPASVQSNQSCNFGSCFGFVSGLVAGPSAERAGVVYHIDDGDRARDLFGSVSFFQDAAAGAPTPLPPPTELFSGAGFAVAYTLLGDVGPAPVSEAQTNANATFSGGQLSGWTSGGQVSDKGAMALVEAASDRFIGWGRWSNPGGTTSFTVNGVAESFDAANESLHFVVGQPTDLAALAAAGGTSLNYSVLTATTPTDGNGILGTFDGATFGVNVAIQRVSGSVDATMSSNSYNLEFYDMNAAGGNFSGSADQVFGSCFSSPCSGLVSGLVAGPAGERAGLVYSIKDPDRGQDVFGSVVFRQDPNGAPPPVIPQ